MEIEQMFAMCRVVYIQGSPDGYIIPVVLADDTGGAAAERSQFPGLAWFDGGAPS